MSPNPTRILIIDDDPVSRFLMVEILKQDGYELSTADSGENILPLLNQFEPDVLLLDVQLPLTSGYELTRMIKKDPYWQHMPIILVTSLDSKEEHTTGLDAGADEFISKPLNAFRLRTRVRTMARVKKRSDQLMNLAKMREDLAHMVVHDLRNPLSICLMHTEMLLGRVGRLKRENPTWLQTTATGFSPHKSILTVKDQLEKLSSQVDDILLMAKTEHDELQLNCAKWDLAAEVRQAAESFRELAEQQKIELHLDLPAAPLEMNLDINLITRLLGNLLSNALKYSPTYGTITLRLHLSADQNSCILEVIDEGIGIPVGERGKIFDRYKIASTQNPTIRGIGLGLAFCKMVVMAHGGTIKVRDNRPQGTVFAITLPWERDSQQRQLPEGSGAPADGSKTAFECEPILIFE